MERPLRMITTGSVPLSFALVVSIGVAGASGQNTVTRKRQESGSSPSASEKSRPKLVEADTARESTSAPAGESTSGTAAAQANGVSKEAVPSPRAEEASGKSANAAKVETPSEPDGTQGTHTTNLSASLRDQIEAAPDGPERLRLRLRLAEQLSQSGQKEEAKAELHSIGKSNVFDPQAFYNAGNALARLGDSDEAINAYRKAIDQRKGKYSRALNNLGVVLFRTGRWDEAHDALLKALNLESFHYAEASYNLGRVYSARGERDLAIREWRRALSVEPDHHAAARALVDSEGEFAISRESPSKPGSFETARGGSANSTGNKAMAVSTESTRAARNTKAPSILALDAVSYDFLQRARDLREHGKLQEAVANYRRVIARQGGYFPPANLELTYILLNQKKNDEALLSLLQISNRDGARYPASYYYLARLYEGKGDLQFAEDSFAKAAMANKTTNPSILLDLSRVREKRGNLKGALAALEEYGSAMEERKQKPAWLEEHLTILRRRVSGRRN
jgi:tetratricopeptide (TPR) repeat protein